MTDNYEELVNLLGENLKLTGTEIVEVLWLATKINYPNVDNHHQKREKSEKEKNISQKESDDNQTPIVPPIKKKEQFNNQSPKKRNNDVGITSKFKKLNDKSLEIAAPDGSSLSDHLEIAKSLRPLRQYVTCSKTTVLNEEATIDKIAELEGIFFPVLKPPLELKFDLGLVVDMSNSMIFWQRTIQEFKQLLKRYGIFRNFESWGLLTDKQGRICLQKGFDYKQKNKKAYSPQRLVDPSGRRLILVVSDCVSPIWRNGLAFSQLTIWGKHNVVAIAQILPEKMWSRTALSLGTMAQLDCTQPYVPNRNLKIKELFVWNKENLSDALKVPVFSLDPELIQTWSEMVVKQGSIGAEGFVFSNLSQSQSSSLSTAKASSELSSEDRIYNFEMSSSLKAVRLAKLLAASPVINLPFVRLLQTIYDFEQHHVAEVFLGNILKPLTPITPNINPDEIQYRFHDEAIRQYLIDSSSRKYSQEIIIRISRYFAERLGTSLKNFYALLQNPAELDKLKQEKKVENFDVDYFARVTTKVLKRLGGAYARLASDIERGLSLEDESVSDKESQKYGDLIPLTRTVALRSLNETLSPEVLARYVRVLNAVNNALSQSDWVEIVNEEEQPDFQLIVNEQGQFEIANTEGEVFTNIRPVLTAEVGNSERTAKRLEHLAKFDIIEQLDNPNSPLKEQINIEVLGKMEDYELGNPIAPEPFEDPENINVNEGEYLFLKILNNYSTTLNFAVLDLKSNWVVSVIEPHDATSRCTPLAPGGEKSIILQATLPEIDRTGLEILKVFATKDPANFHWLELPSLDRPLLLKERGILKDRSKLNPLSKILACFAEDNPNINNHSTRTRNPVVLSQNDWTTTKIAIQILQTRSTIYSRLKDFLVNQQWKEADEETARIMFKIAGREKEKWLRSEDIKKFPSNELLKIDKLWVEYSNNHFGFSIQKKIYRSLGGTKEYNQEITQQFWRETGLIINNQPYWSNYNNLTFDLSAPKGHLPINYDINTPAKVYGVIESLLSRADLDRIELLPLNVEVAKIIIDDKPKASQQLKFETVTIDSSGQTIKEEIHQNTYFEQELGEKIPPLIMMAIPEGEFMMGSPEDEPQRHDRESPQHQVKVSPFWLAQTPVTNAQWNFVVNLPQEQIKLKSTETEEKDDHPVVRVNWYQVIEFCARLSRHTGRNYRLPSEAEWEYACRAGTTTPSNFGKTITGELANYNARETYAQEPSGTYRGEIVPVKSFSPNAFGLYDMHGQVYEWCADPLHQDYKEAPQERDSSVWDELEKSDNYYYNILENLKQLLKGRRSRVLRGGSFDGIPRYCRSAYRGGGDPDNTYDNIGFRVAVSDPRVQ